MHYVITGAGQIGTQLARDLLKGGHQVTVVRRSGTAPEGAALVHGDVQDRDLLVRAIRGDGTTAGPAAAIFHCIHSAYDVRAWRRDLPQREAAVMDIADAAEIPVVFPESAYAFGTGARHLDEDAPVNPSSPLGEARAELLAARESQSATTLSVVAADLLGPTAAAASSVFLQLVIQPTAAGKAPWVLGDPDAPRSATYIPDLSRAMIAAAERAADLAPSGDAILLSPSTEALSQRELAATVADRLGMTAPAVRHIPWPVLSIAGLFSSQFRELHRQRYLWDAPAVMGPARLTTELGLAATPWSEVVDSALTTLTGKPANVVRQ